MTKAEKQTEKTQSIPRKLIRVALVLLALALCWFAMHYILIFIFDLINGMHRKAVPENVLHSAVMEELIPEGNSIGGVTELVCAASIIRREITVLPYAPEQALAMHIKLWQAKGGKVLKKQQFELKRHIPYKHELLMMPDKSVVFLKAEKAPEGTELTVIQCTATAPAVPDMENGTRPLDPAVLDSCPAEAVKLCIGQPFFLMTRGTGQLKSWTFHTETEKKIAAVRLEIQQRCSQQGWTPHKEMTEALQSLRSGKLEVREAVPELMLYRKGNYQCVISLSTDGNRTKLYYRVSEINKQIYTQQGETPHE